MTQHLFAPLNFDFHLPGVIPKARVFTSGPRDLPLICRRLVQTLPILCQILPAWIHRFDQLHLLAATPAFDFFFAVDGGIGRNEPLLIDQTGQVVAAGKAWYHFVLMLPDSSGQIARYTCV
jgi:hypothetical protein